MQACVTPKLLPFTANAEVPLTGTRCPKNWCTGSGAKSSLSHHVGYRAGESSPSCRMAGEAEGRAELIGGSQMLQLRPPQADGWHQGHSPSVTMDALSTLPI